MDNTTVQKVREALSKNDSIAVAVGQNAGIDEMAAALSLYLLLKEANKRVIIAAPSQPTVEVSNLVGIDKVQNSLGGEAGDLVVSFPYLEGEIEKVSYTLENGFLNIIVKASEQGLSFNEKDVKYTKGSGPVNLLFVVGTPRLADLGELFNSDKLHDTKIINIDNKQDNQNFGDIVIVSSRLSSVSEQIADLALSLGFRIDKDAAQNLLSGITTATKNFQEASTSPLAFEMASLLMRKGASRVRDAGSTSPFPQRPQEPRKQLQDRQFQDRPQPQQQRGDDRRQPRFQSNQPQQRQNEQPQPQQNVQQPNEDQSGQDEDQKPPIDWLAPKVYKGSSNF